MLSQQEIDEFNTKGFLRLPKVFSDEKVRGLLEAVREVYENSEGEHDQKSWWNIFHQNDPVSNSSNVWEKRNVVSLDERFLNLIDDSIILPAMCQLLGPRISLLSSHLVIRNKSSLTIEEVAKKSLGWHRDLGVSSVEMSEPHPRLAIKAGIWLTPLTGSHQGAMQVVPGSHRLIGKLPIDGISNRPYGAIEVLAEPGDILIFEQRLWHAGAPNLSNNPRICLFFGWGYRWLRPQDYTFFPEEFLSGLSPIRQQLLGSSKSQMGYHLPTQEDIPIEAWFQNLKGCSK